MSTHGISTGMCLLRDAAQRSKCSPLELFNPCEPEVYLSLLRPLSDRTMGALQKLLLNFSVPTGSRKTNNSGK